MICVLIIYNPNLVQPTQLVRSLPSACERHDGGSLFTSSAGDAKHKTSQVFNQYDVIVVSGGDVLNEVVNGLPDSDQHSVQLVAMPTGTANVMAAELNMPTTISGIKNLIMDRYVRPVHFAKVNDRRFLLMAGVGFDAWVVHGVNIA